MRGDEDFLCVTSANHSTKGRTMPDHTILSTFDIADKVIVATGGGGVLVGAMARGLASEGAKIAILDIFPEKARLSAADCPLCGTGATPI
jgi:hypothetical protein